MDLREAAAKPARRHPWETSRAAFVLELLARQGVFRRAPRILDIGSGDAYLAKRLAAELPADASIVCLDVHYSEAQIAGLNREHALGSRLRFASSEPSERFDLLLFLDVIEHVEDDLEFVGGLVTRCLASGGLALFSVPAWPALYTRHDIALGHFRRYTRRAFRQVLAAAGLRLISEGDMFRSLLPVRALERLLEIATGYRAAPGGPGFGEVHESAGLGGWRGGPLISGVLDACLRLDNKIPSRSPFRVPGLSLWALCQKP